MNQCIHGIDLLRWMMGDEVDSVYGVIKQQFHPYLEAEDVGLAIVRFKNGAVATVEGTVNVYPKNLEETLYLFGEKGTVKIGGKSTNNLEVWDFLEEDKQNITEDHQDSQWNHLHEIQKEPVENIYGNGHISLYADMVSAIENNRKPYIDAEAGRNALELVLAIYKSAKTGQAVKLPLEEFSSMDMKDWKGL